MKVTLNPSIRSLSGTFDNWVYRNVDGQVIVASRAEPTDREPSAAQLAQRKRFLLSLEYAKSVLADPCQRELYEQIAKAQKRRVDRLVAADFLTPPEVQRIDLSGYQGRVGDVIRVIAIDDIEVVAVDVAVKSAAGTVLEQGLATKIHGVWRYTATTAAPAGEPITIVATAMDRPGNRGTGEAVYK